MDLQALREIEQRVLWLATRIVDIANRRGDTQVKVGGHQASCASIVSIMTALWFGHIGGEDKAAVKPHASPVYHAIKYLTGELDRSYLTTLRQRGGLQAYPSRTKDPDVSDFSTGSVGLGAVAPLFSALTRRYVDSHFGAQPPARFIALVGDAELDAICVARSRAMAFGVAQHVAREIDADDRRVLDALADDERDVPWPGSDVEHAALCAKPLQTIRKRRVRARMVHRVVAVRLLGGIHNFRFQDAFHRTRRVAAASGAIQKFACFVRPLSRGGGVAGTRE